MRTQNYTINSLFDLQEFSPEWVVGIPSQWKIGMEVKCPTFAYRGEEKIGVVTEITDIGVVARFQRNRPYHITGQTYEDFYITGNDSRTVTAWKEGCVSS